ncbi:MAG TPA: hypothetical protein VFL85_03350, partial [Candidatus Saccharimonadales bacterium]|nr:hypothetical protein [Candidatus Saccharimonadales bacterium]
MKTASTRHTQAGMVAIMVTLILMIVISLLVLGFAEVSRHEQNNSLDNQLSDQAFYAAESGINDAASVIRDRLATGASLPKKVTCKDTPEYSFSSTSDLSGDGSVSYSCILINPAPLKLNYSVGADPVVVPLISGSGAKFKTITISWTPVPNVDGSMPANPLGGCLSSAGDLPPAKNAGAWACPYPMIRTEIVPTTSLTRSNLLGNTRVDFLEPVTAGPGTVSINQNGQVVGANCSGGSNPVCKVEITNFNSAKYYMRLASIYGSTHVTITATDASGADGLEGAQADIDATGKAHGVLRRIVVAIDLNDANSYRLPSAAIAVGDTICKRFSTGKGFFNVPENIPGANGNPLCIAADVSPPP